MCDACKARAMSCVHCQTYLGPKKRSEFDRVTEEDWDSYGPEVCPECGGHPRDPEIDGEKNENLPFESTADLEREHSNWRD